MTTTTTTELEAAAIQFVRGLDEKVVPDVKLTRARDGSSGIATFQFVKYVSSRHILCLCGRLVLWKSMRFFVDFYRWFELHVFFPFLIVLLLFIFWIHN